MTNEEKTKINIELPTDLLLKCKALAKKEELTISGLVRLLLKKYVEEQNNGTKN